MLCGLMTDVAEAIELFDLPKGSTPLATFLRYSKR